MSSISIAPLRRVLAFALTIALLAAASMAATSPVAAQETEPVVTGAFTAQGDAADGDVHYRWVVPDSSEHWTIRVGGAEGSRPAVALLAPSGERIEQVNAADSLIVPDLDLEAGEYRLIVPRIGADDSAYTLQVSASGPAYDGEPNDRPEWALPVNDGEAIAGRLGRTGRDEDRYSFRVDPGDGRLRDVRLSSESEKDRELCLLDADDEELQCRRAVGEVALLDLGLEPGPYGLLVRGSTDTEAPYEFIIDPTDPAGDDYEQEPNDTFATASDFQADTGVRGRSATVDWDFHRVLIEGEPGLWQIVATGEDIDRLSLVNGSGDELITSTPRGDRTWAELNDALLVPGTHRLKVRARGGDYQIVMTPLGPLDPEGEREPNSDEVHAEPYDIGQTRKGRLVTDEDVDLYRFTLGADARVAFRVEQPADADLEVFLQTGGEEIVRQKAPDVGAPLDLDLLLGAGDYLIRLRPSIPSSGTYVLESRRLPGIGSAVDQEPNDKAWLARPVPPSLTWSGTRPGAGSDSDFFLLPPLTRSADVIVRHSEARPTVRLFSDGGETRIDTSLMDDGVVGAEAVPADVPLFLQLQANGPYEVSVESDGWSPGTDPVSIDLDVTVALESDTVAAYWTEGQRVTGRVLVTNHETAPLRLHLEARASHYAWQPGLDETSVDVPAGGSVEVPISLSVRPDVWAEAPVDIEVIAIDANGVGASGRTTIDAARGRVPVDPHVGWAVPDALLGGLNVAGLALGGESAGTVAADREPALFDDVTPAGGGFIKNVGTPPIDFIVDLAGTSPLPIAGTILNPQAGSPRLSATPREFELLLSTDGATWSPALSGVLSALPIDQSFVLETPMPATHALLRIRSFHNGGRNAMELGEWKVIAEPGVVPDSMPANIAAPARGGHVVRHLPFLNSFAEWRQVLDDDPRRQAAGFDRDASFPFELVVGFQEGRAARIAELVWHDPEGSDEAERLKAVTVEFATEGPLGPWEHIGEWDLERTPDGSVARFSPAAAPWARYVRLSSPLPPDARRVEMPAPLEVLELASSADYRSILGEWGYTRNVGPFEWLTAVPSDEVAAGPDAGDSAATATPLALDTVRADQVEILADDDWYVVEVPSGQNTIDVEVGGTPTATATITLLEPSGAPVPTEFLLRPGGEARYTAAVEPGSYLVRVEQPPFNVAFTFDTSGSMGPFLDFVLEGMREFASDVAPGREAATIVPFGRSSLLPSFTDQPLVLEDAVNNYIPANDSSNAEDGLLEAARQLRGREGAKAILIVTDAETGSLAKGPEVWDAFDQLRPTVYSVHVGAASEPEATRNLMRGWADANGGHYAYPTTHAAMERAFERMSTRLRRPAAYTISAATSFVDRSPAVLAVTSALDQPAALAPGVGVEIILDTSASMRKKLGGSARIDIAKTALRRLLRDTLTDGVPVAMRTFGGGRGKAARCSTRLALPLAPLDTAGATKLVRKLKAEKKTRTPLAAAIAQVESDLADVVGSRTVVLITDGAETCGGDPEAEIVALRESGIDVNVNIVGFALDDDAFKEQLAGWAAAGDGSYFDASGPDALVDAIATAVAAPYRVFEADAAEDAEPVASGTVNGGGVTLDPGFYRVEVLLDPLVTFEAVEVPGGGMVALELPGSEPEA